MTIDTAIAELQKARDAVERLTREGGDVLRERVANSPWWLEETLSKAETALEAAGGELRNAAERLRPAALRREAGQLRERLEELDRELAHLTAPRPRWQRPQRDETERAISNRRLERLARRAEVAIARLERGLGVR
jgi:predicted  nucleic acid-binding Zn-ribbon protein